MVSNLNNLIVLLVNYDKNIILQSSSVAIFNSLSIFLQNSVISLFSYMAINN
jgi:hypothetical protein